MKKIFLSLSTLLIIITLTIGLTSWSDGYHATKSASGAAAGVTGSPADGNNCTACHNGPLASPQTGWITSNVPVSGYVPLTTYTITATATRVGHIKFGFEISPQSISGTLLGTLISTSSATQLVGSNKYITHTSTGTSGTNSRTWTFNWTAPAQGTGSVTFYGAFNITNANNNQTGDTCCTSTLVIPENNSAGVANLNYNQSKINVFPNPVSDNINIQYTLLNTAKVEIKIYDLAGKLTNVLIEETKAAGDYLNNFNIDHSKFRKGIYVVEIIIGNTKSTQKILID